MNFGSDNMAGAHPAVLEAMEGVVARGRFAKAGLEIAMFDAYARSLGVPVHALLGGKVRDSIDCTWALGVAPLDDPQYLVSVAVHRPQGEWGDWEVTNTFQQIMSHTLSTYNVPPSGAEDESYDGFVGDNQDYSW